jgi:hypothetical protein
MFQESFDTADNRLWIVSPRHTIGKYPNNEIMFLLVLQVKNRYSYLPMVKTFLPSVAYRNIGHVWRLYNVNKPRFVTHILWTRSSVLSKYCSHCLILKPFNLIWHLFTTVNPDCAPIVKNRQYKTELPIPTKWELSAFAICFGSIISLFSTTSLLIQVDLFFFGRTSRSVFQNSFGFPLCSFSRCLEKSRRCFRKLACDLIPKLFV